MRDDPCDDDAPSPCTAARLGFGFSKPLVVSVLAVESDDDVSEDVTSDDVMVGVSAAMRASRKLKMPGLSLLWALAVELDVGHFLRGVKPRLALEFCEAVDVLERFRTGELRMGDMPRCLVGVREP